jgi:hypothetical protein
MSDLTSSSVSSRLGEEVYIRQKLEGSVYSSLEYPTRTDRQGEIVEAHRKTFDCIYANIEEHDIEVKGSDFGQWLQKGSGGILGQGKAASGKSALMRYIWDHPRTKEPLTLWATPLPPTAAAFFFGISSVWKHCRTVKK